MYRHAARNIRPSSKSLLVFNSCPLIKNVAVVEKWTMVMEEVTTQMQSVSAVENSLQQSHCLLLIIYILSVIVMAGRFQNKT